MEPTRGQSGKGPDRMPTVLVVDDEPKIAGTFVQFLAGRDCTVLVAADGAIAIRTLAAMQIDVVVADMRMPRPDCWDILDSIQRAGQATQVVVVTGCATSVLHREAEVRGAAAVLEKPFDRATLVRAVREAAILAEPSRGGASVG